MEPLIPAAASTNAAAETPAAQATPVVDTKPPVEAKVDGAPEVKAPDAKAPDEVKPVVPEKYELKLPEGSPLVAAHVEKVAAFAKDKGLSNDQAQVILERESDAVKSFADGQKQKLDNLADVEWPKLAKSDPEIGGDKYNESVETAHRALAKFGTPKLMEELKLTGYGNHPELIRVFAKVGKMMSSDKIVIPGSQAVPTKSAEEILYGSTTQNK